MRGQLVVVVAVGLYVALLLTAGAWSRAAKRRDASRIARVTRVRRPGDRL